MIFAETELVITEDVVGSDELAYFVMDNILPSDCKTHKPPPPHTHTHTANSTRSSMIQFNV